MLVTRWIAAIGLASGAGCGSRGPGQAVETCASESECDDGLDCTTDTCDGGRCEHLPLQARCASGTICDPDQGCTRPPACQDAADCPDPGPCSVAACSVATATCAYEDLDRDADGQSPQICGGADCDDSDDTVFAGATERCNDLDDDCDGQIDGFTEACGSDEGECVSGTYVCRDGTFDPCSGVGAVAELCDGLDNDCDEGTDEDFLAGLPCDGPDGDFCEEGVWVCDSPASAACTDATGTIVEICDDLDNDCSGAADEGDVCIPNIGEWCDPSAGSGEDELNPGCGGSARCLDYGNDQDGMCVVFGCREDNPQTGSNEDSCRLDFGNEYVCIDVDANADTNLADNVCVKKCTPSVDSNLCSDPFACTPVSRRFNFKDTVCFDLACQTDVKCPVSITDDTTCASDADCPGATDFCVLSRDTDGDGTLDVGACSEAGNCNFDNGLCAPHTLCSGAARVGDPCQADIDCPCGGGSCLNEGPYVDVNGIVFQSPRNGYCTILGCRYDEATGATCPAGSACYTAFFFGRLHGHL